MPATGKIKQAVLENSRFFVDVFFKVDHTRPKPVRPNLQNSTIKVRLQIPPHMTRKKILFFSSDVQTVNKHPLCPMLGWDLPDVYTQVFGDPCQSCTLTCRQQETLMWSQCPQLGWKGVTTLSWHFDLKLLGCSIGMSPYDEGPAWQLVLRHHPPNLSAWPVSSQGSLMEYTEQCLARGGAKH